MKGRMIVWTRLWAAEEGQDVVEYTLLLAFIALVGAAAYLGISRSINILWTIANSQLATANAS